MEHSLDYDLDDHKGKLKMSSYIFYYSLFKLNGKIIFILSAICSLVSLFISVYSFNYFIMPRLEFVNLLYACCYCIIYCTVFYAILAVASFVSLFILWILFLMPFAVCRYNKKYKRNGV